MVELVTWLLEHWVITLLGWFAICFIYHFCRRLGELAAGWPWHDEERKMHGED